MTKARKVPRGLKKTVRRTTRKTARRHPLVVGKRVALREKKAKAAPPAPPRKSAVRKDSGPLREPCGRAKALNAGRC